MNLVVSLQQIHKKMNKQHDTVYQIATSLLAKLKLMTAKAVPTTSSTLQKYSEASHQTPRAAVRSDPS